MTDAEILATAAVLAGGACHAATGFGFALVAAPLVAAAFAPEEAIATLLLLGILTSALTLLTEARRPDPLWREAGVMLGWGVAGAVAGALILAALSPTALQLLVSVTVIATLATRSRPQRKKNVNEGSDPSHSAGSDPSHSAAAGLAAGVLTTTTTTNGPPLILNLLALGVPAARMRDTLSVLFVGFGAIGVGAVALGTGGLTLPGAAACGALAGAATVGHVAGRPVFARLAAGHYERAVTALLLTSVVTGAAVALA